MTLSIVAFLIVTVALLGAFCVLPRFWSGDRAKVHKRIQEEFEPPRTGSSPHTLFKDLDVSSLAPGQEYALLNGKPSGIAWPTSASIRQRLETLLRNAHVPLTVTHLCGLSAILAVGLGLAAGWCLGWIGALVVGLVAGIVPWWIVHFRARARREKFLRQLPNAYELMARVIRSGQSVPQAFQAVAEAFEDPLASEFANCQHQQSLGLRPEVVFQEMANRSGILELRIFVMAMMIQRQTGGNLSEVLDRLATLIRTRLRLRQQVRTLTAEGRLQGLTLVILPIVMFVAMFFLNRQYAQVLLDHSTLLWATGGLMGLGVLWIRRIVNFQE